MMELVKRETCLEYYRRRLSEGWKLVSLEGHNAVLLSPDGLGRELDLRNDVETLRPSAPGDECNIDNQTGAACPNHYLNVDEETTDEGSSTVYTYSSSHLRDLYDLPASSGSGTINKITVFFRCAMTHLDLNRARAVIKSNSIVTEGDSKACAFISQWETLSQEWVTNPADSQDWEWSDIDALQIGVSMRGYFITQLTTYCTQLWVEIDYTPAIEAPTVTTQAVTSIGTTTATGNGNITNTGGENCSKRGVCWNTTGSPTVADDKSEETDSFGTGAFTRPMTGLTPGEHYYVKAYAYNSQGYGYGGEVEFTTGVAHEKTLTESLGLVDKVAKAPSLVKTEPLGLVDSYSRTWAIYRTYTELLGLTDTVTATRLLVKVLTELLGLSDTVKKDTSKMLVENLGLVDTYSRVWHAYRTYDELLGLADSIQKDIALHPLVEPLGLADSVTKSASMIKVESLGLEDRVSKHISLHALTEVLGLLDSISYSKNPTVLAKLIRKYLQLVDISGGGEE